MNSKALTTRFVKCGTAPVGKPVHFTAVITTDTVDRDGEVVVPQGMNSTDYERNPVLLYEHDEKQPIGKMVSMKRGERNIEAEFALAPRPENHVGEWLPDTIGSLMEFGALNAMSIGFLGVEARPATKADSMKYGEGLRRVYGKWKLLEVSVVSMPANQEAIVMAVRKGLVSSGAVKSLGVTVPDSVKVEPSQEAPMPRVKRSISVTVPSIAWTVKQGDNCGTGAGGFKPGNTCGGEGGGGGGGGGGGRKPRGPKKPAPAAAPAFPEAPKTGPTERWGKPPAQPIGFGAKPHKLAPPKAPVTVDLPSKRRTTPEGQPLRYGSEEQSNFDRVEITQAFRSGNTAWFYDALDQMGYTPTSQVTENGMMRVQDYQGNKANLSIESLVDTIFGNSVNPNDRNTISSRFQGFKSFRVSVGSQAKAIVRAEILRARGQIYAD